MFGFISDFFAGTKNAFKALFTGVKRIHSPKHLRGGAEILFNPCALLACLFSGTMGSITSFLFGWLKPSRKTVDVLERFTFAGSLLVTSIGAIAVGGISAVTAFSVPSIVCGSGIPPVMYNLAMEEAMKQSMGLLSVAGGAFLCGLLGLESFVGLFMD